MYPFSNRETDSDWVKSKCEMKERRKGGRKGERYSLFGKQFSHFCEKLHMHLLCVLTLLLGMYIKAEVQKL